MTLQTFQKDDSLRPLSILTGYGGLFLDFRNGARKNSAALVR